MFQEPYVKSRREWNPQFQIDRIVTLRFAFPPETQSINDGVEPINDISVNQYPTRCWENNCFATQTSNASVAILETSLLWSNDDTIQTAIISFRCGASRFLALEAIRRWHVPVAERTRRSTSRARRTYSLDYRNETTTLSWIVQDVISADRACNKS